MGQSRKKKESIQWKAKKRKMTVKIKKGREN